MRPKKSLIISILLIGLFFFPNISRAQNKNTTSKKILLTELLDAVSKKYQVFFTYNPKLFEKKLVSNKYLKYPSVVSILKHLKEEIGIYCENLSNGYYVIYLKKPTKNELISVQNFLDKSIQYGIQLNEVVITGNRAKPRTILDSPIPIDNIYAEELKSSGKNTLDRMLTFKVPSFNSQNQAISDATAHYNPADLRGLGPSRILVLINGKRKNQSAQIYLNRTPGKGEVGVDLNSIPPAAISRIEILRDGASAQYGSDAIAGVINIILKKDTDFSSFNTTSGITTELDGFHLSADYNTSFSIANKGFINLTLSYFHQNFTNRAGKPGIEDLPSNPLAHWVEWAKENPALGMRVGQPDMKKQDIFINSEYPINQQIKLYSFHGYTKRAGKSFAYYRAPYWRQSNVGDLGFLSAPEDFVGYQPTFESSINDHINAAGIQFKLNPNWTFDSSITYGSNKILYTVNNSVNSDYLKDHGTSPTTFNPGGYQLENTILNLDFTGIISKKISIATGIEYKKETFKGFEGDSFSYYKGGSDSFAGIKPSESGIWTRNNIAGYLQMDYDINDVFLVGLAGRYEDFSDFGSNFSWKISSRYKITPKAVLRASLSTGFRAPTLHQRHLTNSQYIPIPGSSMPLLQRTLANNNSTVKALGIPNLFAETSENFSAGFTYKHDNNFSASIDFYHIKVHDRILFSSQIGYKNGSPNNITNPVEQILANNNVEAVQLFINAGDTKTTGADIIASYRNIKINKHNTLHLSFASNFNATVLDAITTPNILSSAGYNIFDRQEEGLIVSSRPKSKLIFGANYVTKKWDITINTTRFGKVTITAPESGGTDQILTSKITSDLGFNYKISKSLFLKSYINNLFDIYPDKTLESTQTTQAGKRFQYSSEVQQLGQLGRNFSIGFNYIF